MPISPNVDEPGAYTKQLADTAASPIRRLPQKPLRAWALACVVALTILLTELAGEYFLHKFDHK